MQKKIPRNFRLRADLAEKLEHAAATSKVSATQLVEELLEEYLQPKLDKKVKELHASLTREQKRVKKERSR